MNRRALVYHSCDKLLLESTELEPALGPRMARLLQPRSLYGPDPCCSPPPTWLRSRALNLVARIIQVGGRWWVVAAT